MIDTGANLTNPELSSDIIRRWIYAYNCVPRESDNHPEGHGLCVASKIAGVESGVAKKVSLVIVKATIDLSSTLDAYVKILNDLRRRQMEGEKIAG